eukprot:9134083-Lingulodinium_polyedra.AAC.1
MSTRRERPGLIARPRSTARSNADHAPRQSRCNHDLHANGDEARTEGANMARAQTRPGKTSN